MRSARARDLNEALIIVRWNHRFPEEVGH